MYAYVPQNGEEEVNITEGSDSEEELLGPNTHQCLQNYKVPRSSECAPSTSSGTSAPFLSHLSPTRRVLFVLSILLCIITIVTFLWVIPCDVATCTPVLPAVMKPHSWTAHLMDLEMMGAIEIVSRSSDRSVHGKNIVVLTKRDISMKDRPLFEVVCLDGSTGGRMWAHRLVRPPHGISCQLLDVNRDGVLDCVVAGGKHMLKVIDPLSGLPVWEIAGKGAGVMAMPALLPDVTGDGVPDLITAKSSGPHTALLLVSGATGAVVGVPVPCPAVCAQVSSIIVEQLASLSYTCTDVRGKRSEQTFTLPELLSTWRVTLPKDNVPLVVSVMGETHGDGHRLLIDNEGQCPHKCRLHIVVKDRNNSTLYNRSMNDVYGTAPVPLSLGGLTGFLLKGWHLQGPCGNNTKSAVACNEWTEHVTLVTFNDTDDVHVVNVSQRVIIQFCYQNVTVGATAPTCQPDPRNAYHSMRISDMDGDGSRELLSVTPGYQQLEDGRWSLQSDVTSINLEAELPQLFDPHNYI